MEQKLQTPEVWANQQLATEIGQQVRDIRDKLEMLAYWDSVIADAETAQEIGDEELSTTPLTEFTLAIDTKLSTGSIEAAHSINFDTEVASEEIIGDFNGDNTIDSLDLIVARKALIAQFSDDAKPAPNKPASKKMDVNKNGSFEIADIVMFQSFVMGKISTFPEA